MDPLNPLASVIVFQYNPETLTRTLQARTAGSDNAMTGEVLRLTGPPEESIKCDLEIDATDQLEQAKFPATVMGVSPTLAALEMLIYPKSALVIANEVLARLGIIEVIPPEAPLTLFAWGATRVLPVRITGMTITEERFDPLLNPILAKVSLDLKVLTYHELGLLSVGGTLFMAHQVMKEVMATIGSAGAITGSISASG
jgi:hypothetical protein